MRAGYLADRMSINLELPTAEGMKKLAPNKSHQTILKTDGEGDRYDCCEPTGTGEECVSGTEHIQSVSDRTVFFRKSRGNLREIRRIGSESLPFTASQQKNMKN